MTARHLERSLDAEYRAVEEGHRARLRDGAVFVVSDTDPDLAYRVSAAALADGQVLFTCQPCQRRSGVAVEATHRRLTGNPSCAPCKHAAVAARRLEREGLITWVAGIESGAGWRVPADVLALFTAGHTPEAPTDPFASFPKF